MIYIYNTLNQKKERLQPIKDNKIGIYVCGLTVYDYCHIGNTRVFIIFDIVARYLKASGYKVLYVRNITDIDDKIIKRAFEQKITVQKLTEKFIDAMHEDMSHLGLLPPNIEPRASQHITQIIAMIESLIQKGYAYVASDTVYFDTVKFANYGQLAQQDLTNLRMGIRVEVTDAKHNPLDFVLWKRAKPQEPSWPSPWGNGRPGWHIECSAMSSLYLGEHFEIHGGGIDLKFPHHQNEIAQSEAFFGHKNVDIWMHIGFVEVNKQKMSKSKGIFFTTREVLKLYHPEVIRYFIISSHYRSPLNYTKQNLENAKKSLVKLYMPLIKKDFSAKLINFRSIELEKSTEGDFKDRFNQAMSDDFNTPKALAVLFDLAHEVNRSYENEKLKKAYSLSLILKELAKVLGILQDDPWHFLHYRISSKKEIEKLIKERNEARRNKDWHKADLIRDRLTKLGIELKDSETGTIWEKSS